MFKVNQLFKNEFLCLPLKNHLNIKTKFDILRVNPLYVDCLECNGSSASPNSRKPIEKKLRQTTPPSGERSNSSGYGGSHGDSNQDPLYTDLLKASAILEQNPDFVKSIQVTGKSSTKSSSGGTLTTIPEGKIDFTIPRPIWPYKANKQEATRRDYYDSLVDETLLLYTSFNFAPDSLEAMGNDRQLTVKDVLVDLLHGINATIEGKTGLTAEEMLRCVNEKITLSIETLRASSEDEVKNLCVNLSNCKKVNSVVRAFSNSNSSSGNSSQSSPEWNGDRSRTLSASNTDEIEIYHSPSGSSSSGFSDSGGNRLPVFVHEDLSSVPNGVRNAMIYGTLKSNSKSCKDGTVDDFAPKNRLLRVDDSRPSVWEQYYGIKVVSEGEVKYAAKPTDVPLFVSRTYCYCIYWIM